MPTFTKLWLICWTGIWTFIVWRQLRIRNTWIAAEGLVEEHVRNASGDPARRMRILDGPFKDSTSMMHLTEHANSSEFPIGTTVSVKLSQSDSSICVLPNSDREVLMTLGAFFVLCVLPAVVAAFFYLVAP